MVQIRTLHDLQSTIKGARLLLGLTQQQLADRASVSRKWVSDFERGKISGDAELLLRMLAVLDLRFELRPSLSAGNHFVLSEPAAPPTTSDDLDAYIDELGAS